MKISRGLIASLVFVLTILQCPGLPPAAPATDQILVLVSAADAERQAAIIAGDRTRLEAILSDELRYAHSSGTVDNKASYVDALTAKRTIYESIEYKERNFLPAAPGLVLMTGRVVSHVRSGGQAMVLDLNFLSVWREEHGQWRFLAWQSCRIQRRLRRSNDAVQASDLRLVSVT